MTKSAFLSNASRIGDCECDDVFDFVFVEKEVECRSTDDDYDDVDSYDYCEDICSIISTSTEEENGDEVYLLSDSIDDEITSPTTGLKDSALSVPLVLLKDLDEAHEAAKLARITDFEGINDLITTCSDDEHGIGVGEKEDPFSHSPQHSVLEHADEEKAEGLERFQLQTSASASTLHNDNDDCIGIEDSPSFVLPTYTEANETNATTMNGNSAPINRTFIILPAAAPGINPSSSKITSTTPCHLLTNFSQKEEKQQSGDKNTSSTKNANKKTNGSVSTSRTSNKKRRKKLKLLKKAQAAEKFQHQLAFANLSPPSKEKNSKTFLKHSKKQHRVIPSRCVSKKVANIAVSCAVQSMSSYRKEISRSLHEGKS